MAGIYIHVPFCKQACNYCNFYFSTSTYFLEAYLKTILKEIPIQANYLNNEKIDSIYFGGGTPSMLKSHAISKILEKIQQHHLVDANVEISLEGNPDDLNDEKLSDFKSIGINRLSIGTQSFHQVDLDFMKRAHNVKQATQSIERASQLGINNLSIDLIYGVPTQTENSWNSNLKMLDELGVNHLSCYALTVEEGTPLFHQIRKGKIANIDDHLASKHFNQLQNWAEANSWKHYEISNLCKEENFSKHNTAYWQGKPYLGLGPAAHSYNGKSRQWNVANLKKYIEGVKEGKVVYSKEFLGRREQFNEYIMTGIRTQWGVSKPYLLEHFSEYYSNFEKQLEQINPSWIINSSDKIILSNEGRFYADGIASNLFIDN